MMEMTEYYCIYKKGQLMETKLKEEWTDEMISEYAEHRYGDCFIYGLG